MAPGVDMVFAEDSVQVVHNIWARKSVTLNIIDKTSPISRTGDQPVG